MKTLCLAGLALVFGCRGGWAQEKVVEGAAATQARVFVTDSNSWDVGGRGWIGIQRVCRWRSGRVLRWGAAANGGDHQDIWTAVSAGGCE